MWLRKNKHSQVQPYLPATLVGEGETTVIITVSIIEKCSLVKVLYLLYVLQGCVNFRNHSFPLLAKYYKTYLYPCIASYVYTYACTYVAKQKHPGCKKYKAKQKQHFVMQPQDLISTEAKKLSKILLASSLNDMQ